MIIPNAKLPITQSWTLSRTTKGAALTGNDELAQNILNILETVPGTDPHRPDFGCGIHNLVDVPIVDVRQFLSTAVKRQVEEYEPRVRVLGFTTSLGELGEVIVVIRWAPIDTLQESQTSLTL